MYTQYIPIVSTLFPIHITISIYYIEKVQLCLYETSYVYLGSSSTSRGQVICLHDIPYPSTLSK